MAVREIAGRRFQSEADYQAGLRDLKKIENLRKKYNLNNPSQLTQLYRELENGTYHFETMLGIDFDDEIYELIEKNKKKDVGAGNKAKKETDKGRQKREAKTESHFDEDELKAEAIKKLKKKALVRRIISLVAGGIAVLCLGYFVLYSKELQNVDHTSNALSTLKKKPPVAEPVVHLDETSDVALEILDEYKNLYIKNKSVIGWLKIDDTIIDYPVMQTSNNDYFLNHNFDGEEDKNGSLFLDKDCNVIDRSTNLIIYGHHMKSGKMFGGLNKYSDIAYYEKHPFIQFDSIYEKGVYQVMYVFHDKVYSEEEITFKYYQFIDAYSGEEFRSNMQEMAKMSLYHTGVEASYGDQLLTLSTCDNTEQGGRFVIVAKRIE